MYKKINYIIKTDPLTNKNFTTDGMHKIAFTRAPLKAKPWLLSHLWKKPEDPIEQLSIKACSIKPEAEKVHKDLMKVLDNFSTTDSLYPFVREVVDPLLREIDHILTRLQSNLTPDALDKYSQWTEKARHWVQLCNKLDSENLARAVKEHIIQRSLELIDRDIKLIMEYRSSQNPGADISSFITKLEALKVNPDLPLEKISKWKQEFDLKRQAIVNKAYQDIDQ